MADAQKMARGAKAAPNCATEAVKLLSARGGLLATRPTASPKHPSQEAARQAENGTMQAINRAWTVADGGTSHLGVTGGGARGGTCVSCV